MSNVDDLRRRIDELDRRIVELLVDRLRTASQIGVRKEAAGLSFYDPQRERSVIDRITAAAGDRYPSGPLVSIFREIISASRAVETDRAILAHGDWGSLAHHAALLRFGASARVDVSPRAEDLFAKLEEGICAFAVVSVEGHSLETSLDRLDLFLRSKVGVFAEFYVAPRLALFGPGSSPVHASPPALVQAARWVTRESARREFRVAGTAAAAILGARESGGAVLGYASVGALEGLALQEDGLEDLPEARRRFLVLSPREAAATGQDKTSLLAVIENRPGALHSVAGVLAAHGINLCWLEPKATHLGRWDHLFVLEIEGHRDDPPVAAALEELRSSIELLQVLGSYPKEKPQGRPF